MTAWSITTSDGPVAVLIESSPRGVSARTSGFASPELRCVDTSAERAVVRLFAALALDHGVAVRGIASGGDACEATALRAEVARLRDEVARSTQVDALDREDATTTTVVARIHALGFAYSKHLAWTCGTAAQRAWRRRCGRQPPKANTTKGSGHGAHCHARYPLSWRAELDAIVAACAGDAPTQGRLAL